MTLENFLASDQFEVFRFGTKPVAIDIMTKMADLDFNKCYERVTFFEDDGIIIPVINIHDLVMAKKAAGRNKDLHDIEHL